MASCPRQHAMATNKPVACHLLYKSCWLLVWIVWSWWARSSTLALATRLTTRKHSASSFRISSIAFGLQGSARWALGYISWLSFPHSLFSPPQSPPHLLHSAVLEPVSSSTPHEYPHQFCASVLCILGTFSGNHSVRPAFGSCRPRTAFSFDYQIRPDKDTPLFDFARSRCQLASNHLCFRMSRHYRRISTYFHDWCQNTERLHRWRVSG